MVWKKNPPFVVLGCGSLHLLLMLVVSHIYAAYLTELHLIFHFQWLLGMGVGRVLALATGLPSH